MNKEPLPGVIYNTHGHKLQVVDWRRYIQHMKDTGKFKLPSVPLKEKGDAGK